MEPPQPSGAPMGGQLNIPPPLVVPLVLQVFPLTGYSDREEFFYDYSLMPAMVPLPRCMHSFWNRATRWLSTIARILPAFKWRIPLVPHFALLMISLLGSSPRVMQSFNSWLLLWLLLPLASQRRLLVTSLAMGPGPSPAPYLIAMQTFHQCCCLSTAWSSLNCWCLLWSCFDCRCFLWWIPSLPSA
jgi:hypothetical protein